MKLEHRVRFPVFLILPLPSNLFSVADKELALGLYLIGACCSHRSKRLWLVKASPLRERMTSMVQSSILSFAIVLISSSGVVFRQLPNMNIVTRRGSSGVSTLEYLYRNDIVEFYKLSMSSKQVPYTGHTCTASWPSFTDFLMNL